MGYSIPSLVQFQEVFVHTKKAFLKLFIWNNRKFPWENLTFLDKLYQKFLMFYTLDTHGTLQTEFASFWTTLWPNQKDLGTHGIIYTVFGSIPRSFDRTKKTYF